MVQGGNQNGVWASAMWSWTIEEDEPATPSDTTAPDSSITQGPSGGATTPDPNPRFRFSSSESGSSFECSLDDEAFVWCTSPFQANALADGAHTFEVRATDGAGNVDLTPAVASFSVSAPTCRGMRATLVIEGGGFLRGTSGNDVLVAIGGGDHIIRGHDGNDLICVGAGDDVVYGGAGQDRLSGWLGDDDLRGGSGPDHLRGGLGIDLCLGGSGKDATLSCER